MGTMVAILGRQCLFEQTVRLGQTLEFVFIRVNLREREGRPLGRQEGGTGVDGCVKTIKSD